MDDKRILIDRGTLQPLVNYAVAVKAKMCPGNLYEGPWSEWSSTAEWRTTGTAKIEGRRAFSLPVWNKNKVNFCLMLNQAVEASHRCYVCCGFMPQTIIQVCVSDPPSKLNTYFGCYVSFTGFNGCLFYIPLSIFFVLGLLVLACLQKP